MNRFKHFCNCISAFFCTLFAVTYVDADKTRCRYFSSFFTKSFSNVFCVFVNKLLISFQNRLCFLTVHPCIIFKYNSPTRCIILLTIFISLLYMIRASMCSSSGENYCIYVTLIFVTLYGWRLVCRPDATHTE